MKIGDTGQDICPKHDVHESCFLVAHSHVKGYCYIVFKMQCGHVYVVENFEHHCDLTEDELKGPNGIFLS
jgi:hypothetical protein